MLNIEIVNLQIDFLNLFNLSQGLFKKNLFKKVIPTLPKKNLRLLEILNKIDGRIFIYIMLNIINLFI